MKLGDINLTRQIAALLARENITVIVRNAKTASFDVKSRVLILPPFSSESKDLHDLFVGHEVAHALYTDKDEFEDFVRKIYSKPTRNPDLVKGILNVVEDNRIERLLLEKYPGFITSFSRGYKSLIDRFEWDKVNSESSLPDRINVVSKTREYGKIEFDSEEQALFDRVNSHETFLEACELSIEIYDFIAKRIEEKQQKTEIESDKESSDEDVESDTTTECQSNTDESEEELDESEDLAESEDESCGSSDEESDEESDEDSEESGTSSDDHDQESEEDDRDEESCGSSDEDSDEESTESSETDSEKSDENAESSDNASDGIDLENSEEFATRTNEDFDRAKTSAASERIESVSPDRDLLKRVFSVTDIYEDRPESYKESSERYYTRFLEEKGPIIREMYALFERKKAAWVNSRSRQSKSGVIDVAKLHSYKYNEEIFRSVQNLPKGKSHKIVFLVDLSYSMCNVIRQTVEKTLIMAEFCDRAKIPYQILGFTDLVCARNVTNQIGDGALLNDAGLIRFVDSRKASREIRHDKETFYGLIRNRMINLGGTPLLESLYLVSAVINDFNKTTPTEKTTFIELTDGEGTEPNCETYRNCYWGNKLFICGENIPKVKGGAAPYYYIHNKILEKIRESVTSIIGIRLYECGETPASNSRYVSYKGNDGFLVPTKNRMRSINRLVYLKLKDMKFSTNDLVTNTSDYSLYDQYILVAVDFGTRNSRRQERRVAERAENVSVNAKRRVPKGVIDILSNNLTTSKKKSKHERIFADLVATSIS